MSSCNTTHRSVLTLAASAWLLTSLLYLAGGCAGGGKTAGNDSAINSYVAGVLAYQKGDSVKAMANLQDAVSKKDDLVMARSMLGDLYRSKNDYSAAKEQYEVVARLDPYDYLNHYHLGFVYQLLGELQDAAVSYLKALDLKPTDAPSNMYLGAVYVALSDSARISPQERMELRRRAVPYSERAAEINPNWPDAQANLGKALDAVGNYAKAEGAYRKSLDMDSDNTTTRLYLGENLLFQKKFHEARSVFSELVKIEDSPLNRKRLGDSYAGELNFDDAINQYQAALKLDSLYYPALNEIGRVYVAQYEQGVELNADKRKAAIEVWQQSLAIRRSQPDVMALIQQYSKPKLFQP